MAQSPGPDCVLGELLKNSQEVVVPFLTGYFNNLFSNSLFPEQWSKALLVPIHKKGNVYNPDNYRGISLPVSYTHLTLPTKLSV